MYWGIATLETYTRHLSKFFSFRRHFVTTFDLSVLSAKTHSLRSHGQRIMPTGNRIRLTRNSLAVHSLSRSPEPGSLAVGASGLPGPKRLLLREPWRSEVSPRPPIPREPLVHEHPWRGRGPVPFEIIELYRRVVFLLQASASEVFVIFIIIVFWYRLRSSGVFTEGVPVSVVFFNSSRVFSEAELLV